MDNDPQDGTNEDDRAAFSGVGPVGGTGRMAPLLMAPGTDFGAFGDNMGMDSAYACRSTDNDQGAPVECDIAQGLSSTSYAAAAASGTALLVRDYFHRGSTPTGRRATRERRRSGGQHLGRAPEGGARDLRRLDGGRL